MALYKKSIYEFFIFVKCIPIKKLKFFQQDLYLYLLKFYTYSMSYFIKHELFLYSSSMSRACSISQNSWICTFIYPAIISRKRKIVGEIIFIIFNFKDLVIIFFQQDFYYFFIFLFRKRACFMLFLYAYSMSYFIQLLFI